MKKVLFALMLFPAMSFAEMKEVKFTVSVNNSYFACSYLENLAASYLKDFGAKDIDVDCRGGLPHDAWARVSARFDAPTVESQSTEWKTLKYRNRRDDNCKANTLIVDKLISAFEVVELRKRDMCIDGSGNYRYDIVVLGYK